MEVYYEKTKINAYYYDYFFAGNNFIKIYGGRLMLLKNYIETSMGKLIMLADNNYVRGLWFEDQKYMGSHYDISHIKVGDNNVIQEVANWIREYFLGEKPQIDLDILGPEVTSFRQKVLDILVSVPYGETISYKEIAELISKTDGEKFCSPRAVGGAVGHNPIALLIPCHRVIGSNGSLTGYAGGIERKIKLLELEKVTSKIL